MFQAPVSQTKPHGGSSMRPEPMFGWPVLECTDAGWWQSGPGDDPGVDRLGHVAEVG